MCKPRARLVSLQSGFTLVEFVIALALAMSVSVIYMANSEDRVQQIRSDLVIRETNEIVGGVQKWYAANSVFPGGTSCATAIASMEAIDGFLSIADGTNAFGNTFSTSCTATGFVLTQNVDPDWAPYIRAALPNSALSGASSQTVTVRIYAGTANTPLDTLLHRDAIAGRPELNSVGALNFGSSGDVRNVGNMTTRSVQVSNGADIGTFIGGRLASSAGNGKITTIDQIENVGYIQGGGCYNCPVSQGSMQFAGDLTMESGTESFLDGWTWTTATDNNQLSAVGGIDIAPATKKFVIRSPHIVFTDGATTARPYQSTDTFGGAEYFVPDLAGSSVLIPPATGCASGMVSDAQLLPDASLTRPPGATVTIASTSGGWRVRTNGTSQRVRTNCSYSSIGGV